MDAQEIQTLKALMEYEAAAPHRPLPSPLCLIFRAAGIRIPNLWLSSASIFGEKVGCLQLISMKYQNRAAFYSGSKPTNPWSSFTVKRVRVNAFYNTCSHRGAPVVTEAKWQETTLDLPVPWLDL